MQKCWISCSASLKCEPSSTLLYHSGPEKPGNVILTARGTYHLNICWTLPKGSFERYVVNISNKELNYFFSDVTTVNKANFTNLDPGRIFVVTVTAVAGNFRETSEEASFATCKFNALYCYKYKNSVMFSCQYIWKYSADFPHI